MNKLVCKLAALSFVFGLSVNSFPNTILAKEPVEGGVFVVGTGSEPETFNPDAAPNHPAKAVIENVMNKLVKINGNSQIVPDLAESWEFSEDGKVLTFHLFKDVKWHDGQDFSAEDVKWTFDQIISEEGFAASSLTSLEEVEVIDKDTVAFHLSEPDASILGTIAWHGTQIMPKHIYEGTDWLTNEANMHPIGTGPFKFVEFVPGESIRMEANKDYFKEGPYLDEVILEVKPDAQVAQLAFENGEIDENRWGVAKDQIEKFEKDEEYTVTDVSWPNMASLVFNMEEGAFTDPLIREAVMYGIDSQEIFDKIYFGQGSLAEYYIPYQYDWAINEEAKVMKRDVAKAIELLEEAGLEKDEESYYLEATMVTYPGWTQVVTILQSNLAEIGIKLNHEDLDDGTYDERVPEQKDFDITALGGYIGPDITAIENRFGTGKSMNYGLYSNAEVDKLLEEGRRETDQTKRADIYKNIQTILQEEMPIVPIWNMGGKLVTKSYVKGHPMADEASREINGEIEFTNIWLDK